MIWPKEVTLVTKTQPCRLVQRTKSPNPSLRLQAIVEEILQAYIFPRANSAHKHHQNWANRNMYRKTYQRDSCMKGLGSARRRSWGSLTTHLQELLPSCKGEHSLTFKRHQRSTAARWEGCQMHTLKIVLSHVLTTHLLPRCLKWTERFELEHQWHNFHLTISLWRNFEGRFWSQDPIFWGQGV